MYLSYGRKYKYSLFNYLVIDHPLYGLHFRKNCSIKNLNSLIFDRMAFPPGVPRILNLKENKEKRLNFSINSLAFRGAEFSPYFKKSKLRIFCLGGSTTAGTCVNDNETWPFQIESFFKNNRLDIEVINGGVPSWYSYHDLLRLKNEIYNYVVDVVLLHEGWNEEFFYSSLSLGEKWKPRMVRNVREEYNLYCPPNKFLSNTVLLSLFLLIQAYLKSQVFIPNMRFTNPNRWKVLQNPIYVLSWFDNLVEIAKIALEKNILLYTIDPPGLVNLGDSYQDRQYYIRNSRLTPLYADYQAVSKKIISHVLFETSKLIPCLNVDEDFLNYKGPERVKLFYDEIHLTAKGGRLLAESIGNKLIQNEAFKKRYELANDKAGISNVEFHDSTVQQIRDTIKKNKPYIDWFINSKVNELRNQATRITVDSSEVPRDRYTTF